MEDKMKLDLSGIWEVAFEQDCEKEYKDIIKLPATTEQAGLGKREYKESTLYLGRKWPICGAVWYRRKFVVPAQWDNQYISLYLERSKFTKVWIDEKLIGESYETIIAQRFELGKIVAGEHEIIIRVDNDLAKYECFPESLYNGHQYTEHTQTNWNGILGEMYLESHQGIYIEKVITHRQKKELRINIITNTTQDVILLDANILVYIYDVDTKNIVYQFEDKLKDKIVGISVLNDILKEWDEYTKSLYQIEIAIINPKGEYLCEKYSVYTGRRFVESKGHELRINHRRISLRGSLDCAIYPLTGACPFDIESWVGILGKIKEFGMNHYRFHSWCPPRSAFIAADQLGMYLQVELSCFANGFYQKEDEKYDNTLENYLYDQSIKVLEEFGNHPSFVLFAVGNEMIGNIKAFNELLIRLKETRTDILFSQGANNFLEDPIIGEEDQFFVTMRTKPGKNIRASFSHNDLPLGTIQEKGILGTLNTYEEEAKESSIPLIAHEIGQYQSFPYIEDSKKYTGPLRGDVYTILEQRLKEKGLLEKNKDFYYASGALLVECYKAEIEANLRTSRMSGFQLLGLQDFTGQGTALVGVMDGFLDNKGFIEAKDFKKFCNEVVVMATLPKYCYTIGEDIPVKIYVYNYSGKNKEDTLVVSLKLGEELIASLCENKVLSKQQNVEKVLEGVLPTADVKKAYELTLHVSYGEYENEYSIWVYPKNETLLDEIRMNASKSDRIVIEFTATNQENSKVWVTNTYNENVDKILEKEGVVFLCTSKHEESIEGLFASDFWCYPMFKEACIKSQNPVAPGTLGLLIDAKHPSMDLFPTKNHSQWECSRLSVMV
jgi:Glycosyl hydrolases family 2, TIM barrel domain